MLKTIVLSLVALCMLQGCDQRQPPNVAGQFNVERAFYHNPYQATVMRLVDGQLQPCVFYHDSKINWIPDVVEGQPMYVRITPENYVEFGNRKLQRVDIHVHAATNINGAEIDNGKFGVVSTKVVE